LERNFFIKNIKVQLPKQKPKCTMIKKCTIDGLNKCLDYFLVQ